MNDGDGSRLDKQAFRRSLFFPHGFVVGAFGRPFKKVFNADQCARADGRSDESGGGDRFVACHGSLSDRELLSL